MLQHTMQQFIRVMYIDCCKGCLQAAAHHAAGLQHYASFVSQGGLEKQVT